MKSSQLNINLGIAKWTARHMVNKWSASLKQTRNELADWRWYWSELKRYQELSSIDFRTLLDTLYPCISDHTVETPIEPIYFYQDSWAFERIVMDKPSSHVDVGSHHKFVAFLSKVAPVTMVDIRPLSLRMDSVKFEKGSILDLPFTDQSVSSLSSLCVVEHIGLGRYGDALDALGTEKAVKELKRVVSPEGNLYISVPLDDENRTYFNAHRAFSESYFLQLLSPFQLVDVKYICGNTFSETRAPGFSVGCYHLRNSLAQ